LFGKKQPKQNSPLLSSLAANSPE